MTSQEREKLFTDATMAVGLLVYGDQEKVNRVAQEAPIRAALDALAAQDMKGPSDHEIRRYYACESQGESAIVDTVRHFLEQATGVTHGR